MFLCTTKRIVSCIFIIIICYAIVILKHEPLKFTKLHNIKDDVSCHETIEEDALPSVEDASFSPPDDSIFFHETSCKGWLNSRKACAFESAAKAHPEKKIYVLFSGPIPESILHFTRNSLTELKRYTNIEYARVHAKQYARGTPLEQLFSERKLETSGFKVYHTSDLLRIITMYKYGGLYLDTDIIVVKPLDSLGRNWLARESDWTVSTGAMNVAKDELGQRFIKKLLVEISTSYSPDIWSHNGPEALLRLLCRFCNTTSITDFSRSTCRGIQVYGPEVFYPTAYQYFEQLFEAGNIPKAENTYSVHTWNYLSQDLKVQLESPVDKLAKRHCPIIRELYKDNFGY